MKKKIQKPFDVEAAKRGAKVETKSGHPVRIVCYDKRGSYPILALVDNGDEEVDMSYNIEGKLLYDRYDGDDLVIVEEVEEAKFNVGKWVIAKSGGGNPWLITVVNNDYYELQDTKGHKTIVYRKPVDANYHLWTLKDARAGDVLVDVINCPFIYKDTAIALSTEYPTAYCGLTPEGVLAGTECNGCYWTNSHVRPATKEQCETLFRKLEEEGYKWEAETLTLSKIQRRWRDDENAQIDGFFINGVSQIKFRPGYNTCCYDNIFAAEKHAKSALAMARISQIMANDERFGGVIADEEWIHHENWVILRHNNTLMITSRHAYEYLSFHKREQAELFLKENEDLIKDYYMMD